MEEAKQSNQDISDNELEFDSMFECGNIDRVIMASPTEYDLYMRPDTNTSPSELDKSVVHASVNDTISSERGHSGDEDISSQRV